MSGALVTLAVLRTGHVGYKNDPAVRTDILSHHTCRSANNQGDQVE